MSDVGSEQQVARQLSPVCLNKSQPKYNAETETGDSIQQLSVEKKRQPNSGIYVRNKLKQIAFKMYMLLKEIVIMVILALSYAALINEPAKISRSPAAFPFFSKDSMVTDWYRGQLSIAIDKARASNIAFVMFYAPWNAESQAVRKEFELAAKYMHKQITFAAVNCWQPGSECRRQYSKAYNWPVLIAYPTHGKGIQYKGPKTSAHFVRFLMSILKPFIRLSTETEVHGLLSNYDAVIVGCVNALPGSLDYAVLYTAALRFLEKDPFQEVAFAIMTGPKSGCFDNAAPSLTLHMWNETLWYPQDEQWKPDVILTWIFKNLHQVSMWLYPTGTKSLVLSNYIQPGPALILFTPRNPLHRHIDYYELLHEIGLEYYNCNEKHRVLLTSLLMHTKRIENYFKHVHLLKTCPISEKTNGVQKFPSVITYTVPKKWINNSCCLNLKTPENICFKCDAMELLKDRLPSQCKRLHEQEECVAVYQHKLLKAQDFKTCDKQAKVNEKLKAFWQNDNSDPLSPINLQNFWKLERCRIATIAQKLSPAVFSDSITAGENHNFNKMKVNISGLACKSNISLTLVALDSLKYYHFAERLGINLATVKDKTAAVIINDKMESHYILHERLNDTTLRKFIYNFSAGNLLRSFNSMVTIKSRNTHVYSSQTKCEKRYHSELCLLELNSETFLPTIMQQRKAVIVYYYSKQCSFCNGISYTYLTVARMFASVGALAFTRIDGDLNILPWEFTIDNYPTIILVPSKRKSESRVFPTSLPITVPNLVTFILSNLDPSLKLHAMWSLCNQTKHEDKRESCVTSVRAENLSIIQHTLRAWRNANQLTRSKLLHKLQQLRNLNLLIAHSSYNVEEIEKYLNKFHLLAFEVPSSEKPVLKHNTLRDEL